MLVRLESDGLAGYGECIAPAAPFYGPETAETVWHVITSFLAPCVVGGVVEHPRNLLSAMTAVRGHAMAKAAVEMAGWDLFARLHQQPLWRLLGGTRSYIEAGMSIGVQSSLDLLLQEVGQAIENGYRRIKLKIRPGWDLGVLESVRARYPSIALAADANGAYTSADADRLARVDDYGLEMLEQPFQAEQLIAHARLQARIVTPICLDESIHGSDVAESAIQLKACRAINLKPGRIGGFTESIRLHDLCVQHGLRLIHGGMLETGIGRAHNVHLSTLSHLQSPGDIAGSARYFAPDLIAVPIAVTSAGVIDVPDGHGIGVHVVEDRLDGATVRKWAWQGGGRTRARGSVESGGAPC